MNSFVHSRYIYRAAGRAALSVLALLFSIAFLYVGTHAQEPDDDEAPPPIKQFSKDEKKSLTAETNAKGHTELSLDLMNKRLANAESLNANGRFDDMFKELGAFNALMDESLNFLVTQNKDKGKVLYNFKRLDIGLRSFMPRLETIRRDLPSKYDPYVKRLVKYISEAREKALEPMFGNTVVSDRPDH